MSSKKILKIKFKCVDDWSRPIYKCVDYCTLLSDVNNLANTGDTKETFDARYRANPELLTIHGRHIDDDPSGSALSSEFEIEIVD